MHQVCKVRPTLVTVHTFGWLVLLVPRGPNSDIKGDMHQVCKVRPTLVAVHIP